MALVRDAAQLAPGHYQPLMAVVAPAAEVEAASSAAAGAEMAFVVAAALCSVQSCVAGCGASGSHTRVHARSGG